MKKTVDELKEEIERLADMPSQTPSQTDEQEEFMQVTQVEPKLAVTGKVVTGKNGKVAKVLIVLALLITSAILITLVVPKAIVEHSPFADVANIVEKLHKENYVLNMSDGTSEYPTYLLLNSSRENLMLKLHSETSYSVGMYLNDGEVITIHDTGVYTSEQLSPIGELFNVLEISKQSKYTIAPMTKFTPLQSESDPTPRSEYVLVFNTEEKMKALFKNEKAYTDFVELWLEKDGKETSKSVSSITYTVYEYADKTYEVSCTVKVDGTDYTRWFFEASVKSEPWAFPKECYTNDYTNEQSTSDLYTKVEKILNGLMENIKTN